MGKIYSRRRHLSRVISSISILSLILVLAAIQIHQERIYSYVLHRLWPCVEREGTLPLKSSSIPMHYLLIPYKEYIYRTSVVCRGVQLDQTNQSLFEFHPQYSPYLRGAFPFVIPRREITFDDIEHFYHGASMINQTRQTPFASNITFDPIPYRFDGGMWHPTEVKSIQRTAILVPFQGEAFNAKTCLFNMHAFARRQLLTYVIVLIEQVNPRFNRGRLLNSGVRYLQQQTNLRVTCLVLHDPEFLPEDDGNLYTCESKYAKHGISALRQIGLVHSYRRQNESFIGGVLLLTFAMFQRVNGFSNLYSDGSGENDDIALRFIQYDICVARSNYRVATYVALSPPRHQQSNVRFDLLTWAMLRMKKDGYRQINSMSRIVQLRTTSTFIHLHVDVSDNQRGSTTKLPL